MRVPVDELFARGVGHIVDVEVPGLALDVGVKQHLHQHVAQLLAHVGEIPLVHRLAGLIDLFEEIATDALMRLDPIPRASVLRAEERDEAHKICQRVEITTFKP